jgi:hypothetical protein
VCVCVRVCVSAVSRSTQPVVTAVRNGQDETLSAQSITWLMAANWNFTSQIPAARADLRGVVDDPALGRLTVATGTFTNVLSAGLANLTLEAGDQYSVCVTVVNDAGIASREVCSTPVDVGSVRQQLGSQADSTVFLSPVEQVSFVSAGTACPWPLWALSLLARLAGCIPRRPMSWRTCVIVELCVFVLSTASSPDTSPSDLMAVTDLRPLVSLYFPGATLDQPQVFVGLEALRAFSNATQTRPNLVFGGYGLSMAVEGFASFSFSSPLNVTIVWPTTGNVELDAKRSPVLQVCVSAC